MSPQPDDAPGTRSIRLEVEVPGTPEEVWQAIATGPGITSWFVPAEVAEREGGTISLEFAPGMTETGEVTAWEPPHRFVYTGSESRGRRLAYEWLVEARAGGGCVVRLVNSGFGADADWDDDFHGMEGGWRLFLENLRLVLTHFRGEPAACVTVNGTAPGPAEAAFAALCQALGLPAAAPVGARVAGAAAGAPELAGVVERATPAMLSLRLDAPAPGIAFVAAEGHGETLYLSLYGYFFGAGAREAADRAAPAWRAWMEERFPAQAAA